MAVSCAFFSSKRANRTDLEQLFFFFSTSSVAFRHYCIMTLLRFYILSNAIEQVARQKRQNNNNNNDRHQRKHCKSEIEIYLRVIILVRWFDNSNNFLLKMSVCLFALFKRRTIWSWMNVNSIQFIKEWWKRGRFHRFVK